MQQLLDSFAAIRFQAAVCVILLGALLFAGCTTLRPDFVVPSVNIVSFKVLPSDGLAVPKFEIGLRVVNPNAMMLNPRGMSYRLSLNDYEVVAGAANNLPSVPGYGEAEFKVVATVGIFESIRFANDMLKKPRGQVVYRLKAKLDVGAAVPSIQIESADTFAP